LGAELFRGDGQPVMSKLFAILRTRLNIQITACCST